MISARKFQPVVSFSFLFQYILFLCLRDLTSLLFFYFILNISDGYPTTFMWVRLSVLIISDYCYKD